LKETASTVLQWLVIEKKTFCRYSFTQDSSRVTMITEGRLN